jgi:hypothetical protein
MKDIIKRALKAGGIDLLADTAELVLDSALDSGIVEKIPIFGSMAKAVNIGKAVKDQIFERKLERFLTQLSSINANEVQEFNNKIKEDAKLHQKVGESLLILIERLDEIEKSDWLAKAFRYYMEEKIDFEKFLLFGKAIDRCALSALKQLDIFSNPSDKLPEYSQDIASCGLIHLVGLPMIASKETGSTYRLTNLGEEFVSYML